VSACQVVERSVRFVCFSSVFAYFPVFIGELYCRRRSRQLLHGQGVGVKTTLTLPSTLMHARIRPHATAFLFCSVNLLIYSLHSHTHSFTHTLIQSHTHIFTHTHTHILGVGLHASALLSGACRAAEWQHRHMVVSMRVRMRLRLHCTYVCMYVCVCVCTYAYVCPVHAEQLSDNLDIWW
jgi:hypothetical protein